MADQPPAVAAANDPAEDNNGNTQDTRMADAPEEASTTNSDVESKSAELSTIKREDADEHTNGKQSDDKHSHDRRDNGKRSHSYKRDGRYQSYRPRLIDGSEFEQLPESDDPDEIRTQVEFYFSDANLVQDEHLFRECHGPENRPVSIKHLCTFKRMRRFQPYSAIVKALRESERLVVVDDGNYSGMGNEGVKRKEALVVPKKDDDDKDPPSLDELFHRSKKLFINDDKTTAYVKGFIDGAPGDDNDVGQLTLEQFFKPYGSIAVRKRRDARNYFKGSVFVMFESKDAMEQFINLDPKPRYHGRELLVMSKRGYSEMKCAEKGIIPSWKRDSEESKNRSEGRGRNDGHRRSHGRNDRRDHGRGDRDYDRRNRDYGRRSHRDGERRSHRSHRDRDGRSRRDSSGSVSDDDWNKRRDRFQTSKDADGVSLVKKEQSSKRKAEEATPGSPKRAKLEIKEDE